MEGTLDNTIDQLASRTEQLESQATEILSTLGIDQPAVAGTPQPSGPDTALSRRISRFQALNSRLGDVFGDLDRVLSELSKI